MDKLKAYNRYSRYSEDNLTRVLKCTAAAVAREVHWSHSLLCVTLNASENLGASGFM